MTGRQRDKVVAARAERLLADQLSAEAYAAYFEAQMRCGGMRRLLSAGCLWLARAGTVLTGLVCGVGPIATAPAGDQDRHVALRVLIVDDSRKFRDAAAELLAEMGLEVLDAVADADQALAAVAHRRPDGILLDINLPGLDGFAVAGSLAAVCPAARIVLTSAELDRVPANILQSCAAVAFVPKQELAVADLGALFAG